MNDLISRQAAIDALDEIRHALWEIDIPSPTVPEYIEHHEQVQSVWKLLDKKQKELYAMPSAQPDKEKISDALYNVYRNKGTSTSAEGVAAIKYYIAEIWREIYGEEGPGWLKK